MIVYSRKEDQKMIYVLKIRPDDGVKRTKFC